MSPKVAFVLKGYPRLSETFIAQEIEELEKRGLDIVLVSLRWPTDVEAHPVHRRIKAPIHYLPEYLWREPARVWRAWRAVRRLPGYAAARRLWLRDLRRDVTLNRVRRFGQALVLSHEVAPSVGHLHAHFLHTPASVTRYAARIADLPWSCSAHAKDIWTTPSWEKSEKLADCRWAVTCTGVNRDHLAALAPFGRVSLVYHGVDPEYFAPSVEREPSRDGSDPRQPVTILSVGRTVPKKGYDDLIDALAALHPELHWRFVHIGGGFLLKRLRRQAERVGLGGRVSWLGSQSQDAVLDKYRQADLFALACRVDKNGDRDGIPNVLLEALSQSLAVVTTQVSAIPELVIDRENGILVPPRDPSALAAALANLIVNPALRARLGRAGRDRVCTMFHKDRGIADLAKKFGIGG